MIELRESDPSWPGLFSREETRIRSILGNRVRLLEHVGSTSVPGLVAKPIIDLVLAVADSADEGSYVPPLEAQGYVFANQTGSSIGSLQWCALMDRELHQAERALRSAQRGEGHSQVSTHETLRG